MAPQQCCYTHTHSAVTSVKCTLNDGKLSLTSSSPSSCSLTDKGDKRLTAWLMQILVGVAVCVRASLNKRHIFSTGIFCMRSQIHLAETEAEWVWSEVNSFFLHDASQRKPPSFSVNAPKSVGFKGKFKDVNSNSSKITGDVWVWKLGCWSTWPDVEGCNSSWQNVKPISHST